MTYTGQELLQHIREGPFFFQSSKRLLPEMLDWDKLLSSLTLRDEDEKVLFLQIWSVSIEASLEVRSNIAKMIPDRSDSEAVRIMKLWLQSYTQNVAEEIERVHLFAGAIEARSADMKDRIRKCESHLNRCIDKALARYNLHKAIFIPHGQRIESIREDKSEMTEQQIITNSKSIIDDIEGALLLIQDTIEAKCRELEALGWKVTPRIERGSDFLSVIQNIERECPNVRDAVVNDGRIWSTGANDGGTLPESCSMGRPGDAERPCGGDVDMVARPHADPHFTPAVWGEMVTARDTGRDCESVVESGLSSCYAKPLGPSYVPGQEDSIHTNWNSPSKSDDQKPNEGDIPSDNQVQHLDEPTPVVGGKPEIRYVAGSAIEVGKVTTGKEAKDVVGWRVDAAPSDPTDGSQVDDSLRDGPRPHTLLPGVAVLSGAGRESGANGEPERASPALSEGVCGIERNSGAPGACSHNVTAGHNESSEIVGSALGGETNNKVMDKVGISPQMTSIGGGR